MLDLSTIFVVRSNQNPLNDYPLGSLFLCKFIFIDTTIYIFNIFDKKVFLTM